MNRTFVSGFLLVLLANAVVCPSAAQSQEAVGAGGAEVDMGPISGVRASDGICEFSASTRFESKSNIGFMSCSIQTEEGPQWVYLIAVKRPPEVKGKSFPIDLESSNGIAELSHEAIFPEYAIKAAYGRHSRANAARERFSLQAFEADLSKGRVFVVDLASNPNAVLQVNYEFPENEDISPNPGVSAQKLWYHYIHPSIEKKTSKVGVLRRKLEK